MLTSPGLAASDLMIRMQFVLFVLVGLVGLGIWFAAYGRTLGWWAGLVMIVALIVMGVAFAVHGCSPVIDGCGG